MSISRTFQNFFIDFQDFPGLFWDSGQFPGLFQDFQDFQDSVRTLCNLPDFQFKYYTK